MSVPRLTVPLQLEERVQVPDGMGGFAQNWAVLGRVWADMRSGTGGERTAGLGQQGVVTWRVILRAAPAGDPRRPRPDQRLVMGAGPSRRIFRIEAVAEAGMGGRHLVCFAKEEGSP